jgi:hypothetical protein
MGNAMLPARIPRIIFSHLPQRRADGAVLEMLVIRVDAVGNSPTF